MKFKAPGDTPVYIALLSGHSAVISNEWRELPPIMHRKALEEGCITDNMDQATIDAKIESAVPAEDKRDVLVRVIKAMMADPKEGDFTGADLPSLKRLAKNAGWNVNREEMMQAVHAIANESENDAD